ncbi:hypothetical protein ACFYS7_38665 [Streptomyces avermitilis]
MSSAPPVSPDNVDAEFREGNKGTIDAWRTDLRQRARCRRAP